MRVRGHSPSTPARVLTAGTAWWRQDPDPASAAPNVVDRAGGPAARTPEPTRSASDVHDDPLRTEGDAGGAGAGNSEHRVEGSGDRQRRSRRWSGWLGNAEARQPALARYPFGFVDSESPGTASRTPFRASPTYALPRPPTRSRGVHSATVDSAGSWNPRAAARSCCWTRERAVHSLLT